MLGFRKVPSTFLKEREKPLYLTEDYNGENMPQFAVISPDGTQVGDWMNCKDFIQDTIWGAKNKLAYAIYGWQFNPKEDNISKRYVLLALRWPGKNANTLKGALSNVKATIEDVEKRIGIPLYQRTRFSRVIRGECEKSHFVIYGSPMWLRCIGTISFFTWLIRVSLTNSEGTFAALNGNKPAVSRDAYYLRTGKEFIEQLFSRGFESFEPDWDNKNVKEVHHNGFVKYSALIKNKKPTKVFSTSTKFITSDEDDWDEDY